MELLIIAGIVLLGLGLLLFLLSMMARLLTAETEVRRGAVLMIGPIPIVLADDPQTAKVLMVLALVLTIVSVIAMFVIRGV